MLQELIQTVVATIGISGFFITFVQAQHIKNEEQVSVAARRRRLAAKSVIFKEKYGSSALLSAFVLFILACTVVCLFPLLGLAVFPRNSLWGIISAFGTLLWVRYVFYQIARCFL